MNKSFENSNLNCFVSNFDIRDSDFQAMISHRINRTIRMLPKGEGGWWGFSVRPAFSNPVWKLLQGSITGRRAAETGVVEGLESGAPFTQH